MNYCFAGFSKGASNFPRIGDEQHCNRIISNIVEAMNFTCRYNGDFHRANRCSRPSELGFRMSTQRAARSPDRFRCPFCLRDSQATLPLDLLLPVQAEIGQDFPATHLRLSTEMKGGPIARLMERRADMAIATLDGVPLDEVKTRRQRMMVHKDHI